jgi:hypothetical protein
MLKIPETSLTNSYSWSRTESVSTRNVRNRKVRTHISPHRLQNIMKLNMEAKTKRGQEGATTYSRTTSSTGICTNTVLDKTGCTLGYSDFEIFLK